MYCDKLHIVESIEFMHYHANADVASIFPIM